MKETTSFWHPGSSFTYWGDGISLPSHSQNPKPHSDSLLTSISQSSNPCMNPSIANSLQTTLPLSHAIYTNSSSRTQTVQQPTHPTKQTRPSTPQNSKSNPPNYLDRVTTPRWRNVHRQDTSSAFPKHCTFFVSTIIPIYKVYKQAIYIQRILVLNSEKTGLLCKIPLVCPISLRRQKDSEIQSSTCI